MRALAATDVAVTEAANKLDALVGFLASRLNTRQLPDLDGLQELLTAIDSLLKEKLAERGLRGGDVEPAAPALPQDGAAVSAASPQASPLGEIRSREDVVRALERICDYYYRNEPSSPVPLLLRRAQRLATGSFMEIVRDLAPDAIKTIEQICGAEESA